MAEPIAILGGTFDPVHLGHLRAAADVRAALGLSEVRLLPSGQPPHRRDTVATAEQRLAMLRLALQGKTGLVLDLREMHREGPSWMVDTLQELRALYPETPLCLVIGQDAANGLDRWHRWRQLPKLAHLVVMTRPGERAEYPAALAAELAPRQVAQASRLRDCTHGLLLQVPVSAVDISSTRVRERVAGGASLEGWVSPGVAEYIRAQRLYGASPEV